MLRKVQFDLCATNHAEVFLGDIACCQASIDTHQAFLPDRRREADAIDIDTAVEAYCKVLALFANLCMTGQSPCGKQQGSPYTIFYLHCLWI